MDYTVIVDDSDSQIIYGLGGDSWALFVNSSQGYQGTAHTAMSRDANLIFPFVGGREIIIRGNFIGENDSSGNGNYPIFQVDSQNLICTPDVPQNGGQFLCSTSSLPMEVANRTLSMFVNPNAENQFHIDYIRHGSSSQSAWAANGTTVFISSPNNSTPGLSFEGDWQYQPPGGASDIRRAMQTLTPSSKVTYSFAGDSFAWWSCCISVDTSANAANGTYSIDGGEAIPFQVDGRFIQSVQCKDTEILFQTQTGQLQAGNHTLEVIYNGDDTKIPLTLCALAATPLDFSVLDIVPSSSIRSNPSPTPSSSTAPDRHPFPSSSLTPDDRHHGLTQDALIAIACIVSGVTVALIILVVGIIWWRRKIAKRSAHESRPGSTDSLLPFAFHSVVGFIDMDKRSSASFGSHPASDAASSNIPKELPVSDEQDDRNVSSRTETLPSPPQLESRPPSYRSTGSLPNL
ncbi:hypothetical protein D9619_005345 [Psilocybe cf. subviscida]|uniref:Uncharacterized protein n=1 Tax=Psilocybe cf. subviscida TaxID=2480587 RepID=A0A8H5FBU5_9AGAR|nr:hypothetical protein D9619_005345 [Psilocybe cf. subviscida]